MLLTAGCEAGFSSDGSEDVPDVVLAAGPLEDEKLEGSVVGFEEEELAGSFREPGRLVVGVVDSAGVSAGNSGRIPGSTGIAATCLGHILLTAIVPAIPTPSSTSAATPPPIASHIPIDEPPARGRWLGN